VRVGYLHAREHIGDAGHYPPANVLVGKNPTRACTRRVPAGIGFTHPVLQLDLDGDAGALVEVGVRASSGEGLTARRMGEVAVDPSA
jgi:hypothetical protein